MTFDLVPELTLGGLELADLDGALAGLLPGCRSGLFELVHVLVHLGGVVSAEHAAEVGVGLGHRVPVVALAVRERLGVGCWGAVLSATGVAGPVATTECSAAECSGTARASITPERWLSCAVMSSRLWARAFTSARAWVRSSRASARLVSASARAAARVVVASSLSLIHISEPTRLGMISYA